MYFSISKRWGGIDFKVWLCFISLALISIGLLAYKAITYTPCADFKITVSGKLNHTEAHTAYTFYVNEQLTFSTTLKGNSNNIIWDLDDGSGRKAGNTVTQVYTREGYYLVKAFLNGQCLQSVNIRITQSNLAMTTDAPAISPIVSADIIAAGDEAIFNTSAVGANYEWSIEEMPEQSSQATNSAKFIFTKTGNFTIVLKVDNNKIYKKIIQVIDAAASLAQAPALPSVTPVDVPPVPQDPLPLPEKKPLEDPKDNEPVEAETPKTSKNWEQLPEPAIQTMLQGVIDGKKNMEDFNNILCNGAGTKVMANNQPTTFAALCNELQQKKNIIVIKKKRKIESFQAVRDETNGNCVKIIYIKYK
ncbi:PKD domain-containing protein [Niabella aquatica]